MKIPLMKRWLSYLFPVRVKTAKGSGDSMLELFLYRGRWQLGSGDALYSDGDRYRPLTAAYHQLADLLPRVKDVLMLGGGLGSGVQLFRKQGLHPSVVFVEKDEVILQLALELMPPELHANLLPLCADAKEFMNANEKSFDLIIVDVFDGRTVPGFVMEEPFLRQCAQKIRTNGALVLNYIINDEKKWKHDQAVFSKVFPQHKTIALGLNRLLIVRA